MSPSNKPEFDENEICDFCGATDGAYEFCGDFYCAECLATMFDCSDRVEEIEYG